jgi:Ca2+:H+ antiporter
MSGNNDNTTRSWPYATIPGSKLHPEPIIINIQHHNETRWVECRDLPPIRSHDLESHGNPPSGPSRLSRLSMFNHDDTTALAHDESGRRGFHPWTFLVICWKSSSRASMLTNSLWPFTIAALVLHYCDTDNQLWIFVSAYVGMVPAANLVGFAGHQLARKLPTTFGVLVETAIGSCVELILLTVLIQQKGNMSIRVIRAVILGSILANLLLCLGLCFFVGGVFYPNQAFNVAISEVSCNLMLVAGMGLVIPSIFYNSLRLSSNHSNDFLEDSALRLSRVVAVVLLAAFLAYLWFQTRSHFGIYQDILQADESTDRRNQFKPAAKLTLTEALVAVALGVAFVSFMAVFLVQQIEVSQMLEGRGASRTSSQTPIR